MPDGPSSSHVAAPAQTSAASRADNLDRQLEDLGRNGAVLDSVSAGRVHLLNLEAVRDRLGRRWESSAERIHSLVEAELRSRLSRRDFYSRTNETGYVVVFGDSSDAEAKLKIALLTESILAKLFGGKEAEELRALSVRSLVAKADGQLATQPLESTDSLLASLAAAQPLEPAGEEAERQRVEGLSEEEITRLLVDLDGQLATLKDTARFRQQPQITVSRLHEILAHLKTLEGKLARRLDDLVGAGTPDRPEIALNPGLIRVAHHSLASLRRIKQEAEVQLEQTQAAAEPPSKEGLQLGEARLEVLYQPVWHVPTRKVGVYLPQARLITDAGELSVAEAAFEDDLQEAIDRLVLLQSRRDLEAAIDSGSPAVVAIPVQYGTLARIGSQRRYLDLCRNIRPEDRRFIIWQIEGMPRQAFQSQLRSFVGLLRPFGRSISLMLTLTEQTMPHLAHDLEHVAFAGVSAVGFDTRQTGADESNLIKLFDYLAQLAEKVKLKCYATGIQTHSLVLAAACGGYNYVAGPAVADPLEKLGGVQTAGLEQIYFGKATPTVPDPERILG